MRVMALALAGLFAATAAGAQTIGGTPADALGAGAAPPSVPGPAGLSATPGAAALQPGALPRTGARVPSGRAALAAGEPLQPAQNTRQQELDRRSRELDRRVMRSICSGC